MDQTLCLQKSIRSCHLFYFIFALCFLRNRKAKSWVRICHVQWHVPWYFYFFFSFLTFCYHIFLKVYYPYETIITRATVVGTSLGSGSVSVLTSFFFFFFAKLCNISRQALRNCKACCVLDLATFSFWTATSWVEVLDLMYIVLSKLMSHWTAPNC